MKTKIIFIILCFLSLNVIGQGVITRESTRRTKPKTTVKKPVKKSTKHSQPKQETVQYISEAERKYRKAAEQGYASAQCHLGYCYEMGKGVTQDYAEAVKWYRKAAEQGDSYAKDRLRELGYE